MLGGTPPMVLAPAGPPHMQLYCVVMSGHFSEIPDVACNARSSLLGGVSQHCGPVSDCNTSSPLLREGANQCCDPLQISGRQGLACSVAHPVKPSALHPSGLPLTTGLIPLLSSGQKPGIAAPNGSDGEREGPGSPPASEPSIKEIVTV